MENRVIHYIPFAGQPLSAVLQVETATVVGTVTGSGDATVIVTASGMTGSPKTISVAVTDTDTAAVVAGKIRTALAADADVSALFTVSGATDKVILTRITSAANDATLNISVDNGTCTGLTTAASSANTTSGVYGTYRGVPNGTACLDTTNGKLYLNYGTEALPVWTAQ